MQQAQYFHVVPDKNVRENHLLTIGTPEYNRVRYPVGSNPSRPLWRQLLRSDLEKRADGKYDTYKTPQGFIISGAADSLRRDLKNCIYAQIHFKSKTFEYNATKYEFKVKGKYVATLDPDRGLIGKFSIQHTNDKYSRYRLRDLGIRLTSIKGKTYWEFRVGGDYYKYLMAIHGSIDKMRHTYRNIFPSINVSKQAVILGSDLVNITFKCQLREDISYPVFPPDRPFYLSIGTYTYESGIFHNYTAEPCTEIKCRYTPYQGCIFQVENLSPSILDSRNPHTIYNISKFMKSLLRDAVLVSLVKKHYRDGEEELTVDDWNGLSLRFNFAARKVELEFLTKYLTYSFAELDIEALFKGKALRFTIKGTHELTLFKKINSNIRLVTEEGEVDLKLADRFFNDEHVKEHLVGKELLIG